MSNVWICIGIPFSGKSTWRDMFLNDHPDTLVICPDEIRKELCGSINDQTQNSKVFSTAYRRLANAINCEITNIIFDGTNIKGDTRKQIMECDTRGTSLFHYVIFPCDLSTAMARKKGDAYRIAQGERSDVPDHIIEKFFNDFQNNIDNILVDGRMESIKVIRAE
jgi:predicted kinase